MGALDDMMDNAKKEMTKAAIKQKAKANEPKPKNFNNQGS